MVAQKQEERKVYHLLHGKPPGITRATVYQTIGVEVTLPEYGTTRQKRYLLNADPRDERVLIVWDGALLPNGLPRGSTIIDIVPLCVVGRHNAPSDGGYGVPWEQAYKKRTTDPTTNVFLPRPMADPLLGREFGVQEVARFIILMRTNRTATVLRFDDKRLAPRYVFVEVEKGGGNVRWRQSSY